MIEITGKEAEEVRTRTVARNTGLLVGLRAGKMLFLPGKTSRSVSAYRAYLKTRDRLLLKARTGEHDGQPGVFLWTEPIE